MYLPDLFGAYMKGREAAIDANWKDLQRYEQIEAMRNANDLSSLDLLRQRARFGGEMNVFQNNVDSSARANEVAEALQPSMLAKADTAGMADMDKRSAFINNRPEYQQSINAMLGANIGNREAQAQLMQGRADQLRQDGNAYLMGGQMADAALANAEAQSILAGNAANAAGQQVALSNLAARNAIADGNLAYQRAQQAQALLPQQAEYNAQQMQNILAQQQMQLQTAERAAQGQPQQAGARPLNLELVASFVSRAQQGDAGAVYWLAANGLAADGTPLQQQSAPPIQQAGQMVQTAGQPQAVTDASRAQAALAAIQQARQAAYPQAQLVPVQTQYGVYSAPLMLAPRN